MSLTSSVSQDTRILLVVSNFGHLMRVLIPSMISELETAFSSSMAEERRVCRSPLLRLILFCPHTEYHASNDSR